MIITPSQSLAEGTKISLQNMLARMKSLKHLVLNFSSCIRNNVFTIPSTIEVLSVKGIAIHVKRPCCLERLFVMWTVGQKLFSEETP